MSRHLIYFLGGIQKVCLHGKILDFFNPLSVHSLIGRLCIVKPLFLITKGDNYMVNKGLKTPLRNFRMAP